MNEVTLKALKRAMDRQIAGDLQFAEHVYLRVVEEDACLNYHNNTRTVKTASFLQIRKPLYTSSRGRWKTYMSELEPLAEIIGYPLELPVSITLGRNVLG